MQGEITAIGDVMTGMLGARAIEPGAGEGRHGQGTGLCLNCGTRLAGAYCHACGQSAEVHRSVGAIGHEIAHGVYHFEGKVWRTLPLLVLHPGALTRRYVAGERARFLSPLALFLFTVFLLFATINAIGWNGDVPSMADPDAAAHRMQTARAIDRAGAQLSAAERQRAVLAAEHQPTAEADSRIAALRMTIEGLTLLRNRGDGAAPSMIGGPIRTGWARLDEGIARARADPAFAIYKLQSSAYKYSWLLIPLSTPFVALLFLWRRRFGLYDHAIFVTYSIAFMMLLTIVLTVAGALGMGGDGMSLVALAVPPIHMFAQLRGAYSLRRRSAAWRTIVLLAFAFGVLGTFAVLLLIHGLTD